MPKPKVALLLFPSFSEFEITVASAILRQAYQLETLALEDHPIESEAGLRVLPDRLIAASAPEDYDALIIPGGGDLSSVMDHPAVLDFTRAIHRQHKLLAAICAGSIVLAKAGVLDQTPYTTSIYRRYRDMLGCFHEGFFRKEPLVEEGNVITAQGYAFVAFGLRVGERLQAIRDLAGVQAYYTGQGDIHWED